LSEVSSSSSSVKDFLPKLRNFLKEAAKILIQHFMLFSDEKITVNMEDTNGAEEFDEDVSTR